MKKRSIFALFFLLTLLAAIARDQRPPPFENVREIQMQSPEGWWANFYPDNSATLGYGSCDEAAVPSGAFKFRDIYQLLAREVTPDGRMSIPGTVAIAFGDKTKKPSEPTYCMYVHRSPAVAKLFRDLYDKALPQALEKARIKEIRSNHPLPSD
jgi:hypothetical protein